MAGRPKGEIMIDPDTDDPSDAFVRSVRIVYGENQTNQKIQKLLDELQRRRCIVLKPSDNSVRELTRELTASGWWE